jgi:hypothetical protein
MRAQCVICLGSFSKTVALACGPGFDLFVLGLARNALLGARPYGYRPWS